jgi:hypothetical protein
MERRRARANEVARDGTALRHVRRRRAATDDGGSSDDDVARDPATLETPAATSQRAPATTEGLAEAMNAVATTTGEIQRRRAARDAKACTSGDDARRRMRWCAPPTTLRAAE